MKTIDHDDLDFVTGGAKRATYKNTCARGAVDGAITGAGSGASALPILALSGPVSPVAASALVGGGATVGAAVGCGNGMWQLYKARNPLVVE